MKNVFFILMGVIAMTSTAKAQDSNADIQRCVKVMLGNEKMTQAKAEYACANPYLEARAGDSKEQEEMRQDLAQDAGEAKEEMLRPYIENN